MKLPGRRHLVTVSAVAAALCLYDPVDPDAMAMVQQDRGLQGRAAALTAISKGRDYALLFATDQYIDPAWRSLRNPLRDARTIAAELSDSYGFTEATVVPNPSLKVIFDTLDEYLRKRRFADTDQLFIFFAGHGLYRPELDLGFIVASDSKAPDLDRPNQSFFPFATLYRYVDRIRAKHIFLVLDVCHGGTFADAMAMRGDPPRSDYDLASPAERVSRILQRTTRKFLTSGGNEYVPDGSGAHSPFAAKFIEALRRRGPDGIVTATDIYQVVRNVRPNMPILGDFGQYEPVSDFAFVAKSVPLAAPPPTVSRDVPIAPATRAGVQRLATIGYVDFKRLTDGKSNAPAAAGLKLGDPALDAALRASGTSFVFSAQDSGLVWADTGLDLTAAIQRRLNDPRAPVAVGAALAQIRAGVVDVQSLASTTKLGNSLSQRVQAVDAARQAEAQKTAQGEFAAVLLPVLERRAVSAGLDVIFSKADAGFAWAAADMDVSAAVAADLDALYGRPAPAPPAVPHPAPSSDFGYADVQRIANMSVLGKAFAARVKTLQETTVKQLAFLTEPARSRRAAEANKEQETLQSQLQLEFQAELMPVFESVARAKRRRVVLSVGDGGLLWVNTNADMTGALIQALDAATSKRKTP